MARGKTLVAWETLWEKFTWSFLYGFVGWMLLGLALNPGTGVFVNALEGTIQRLSTTPLGSPGGGMS